MRVIVGMSGGVDSSVSALLLKQQGFTVEGLFMKNWEEDDTDNYCAAAQDRLDAEKVCEKIGIPLHTVNFASEYWDKVFAHFLQEYQAGRTPNPDILCNKEIKFKAFLDYAHYLKADAIATGHYARKITHQGIHGLYKALDPDKDQSYFLYTLTQKPLQHTLFPLGELKKIEVRALASSQGLITAQKKDSTGICFIGERKFKTFLSTYLPAQPGDIVTPEGKCLGQHDGLMYYTIGQRQGIGIGGQRTAVSGDPWYVVEKCLDSNALVVAQGTHHPLLYKSTLMAQDLSWISPEPPMFPLQCAAKIRYRQADQRCTVYALDNQLYRIEFDTPQRAITPGQAIVFYDADRCLGGGTIVCD
ncbi:MAG: tRNA 2-thiouridylase [Pseudomonadota bacterium]|jgi:tRNA-specific 2-thiouridylase